MKQKRKHWKQLLSAMLAAAVTVTSIPVTEVKADNEKPAVGMENFNYSRMESIMQDGKEIAYKNNESGVSKEAPLISPMSFGEMVYLQFALPANTNYTMKVLDANRTELGYMYAKFYTEHADGSVEGGYTSRGKTMDAIKLELKNFVYEMPYSPATNFFGIGLDGSPLAYRTLSEYYDFYGIEPTEEEPEDMQSKEADMPEEIETLPENESGDGNTEESPGEGETPAGDGSEGGIPEDTEMEEEIPGPEEEPDEKEEEAEETSKAETEEAVDGTEGAEEEASEIRQEPKEPEETVQVPGEVPSGEEKTTAAGILTGALSRMKGFLSYCVTPMRVEAAGLPTEEISSEEEEPSDEEEAEETKEDVWVPEDELPEDFYIERDFRISTYAATDPNILHNFVVWKGEICDAAGGNIRYLQPGNYTIVIQPKAQSLANKKIELPFTIGGSGEGGALTPEDVLSVIFRDMVFFPGFSSGYPSLKMCSGGDPVDLLSGGLTWNYTDLTLDGKNPLVFTRTYLSSMHELFHTQIGVKTAQWRAAARQEIYGVLF